jgi:putative endonuclease
MKNNWIVYLLRCSSNDALYCGVTTNLKERIIKHNTGKGAKYTKTFGPVSLVVSKGGFTKKDAYKMEYYVKQLPKIEKVPFMEKL